MKPTLFPGDVVLANLKDTIVREGIYVIRIEDALIIKRLQRLSGNVIKFISDNSMYESRTADLKDSTHKLTIVDRVVWACQKI
jgi:phage repressor protein C with HTH and peptisase S24 domain